jgi:hypothetical protein
VGDLSFGSLMRVDEDEMFGQVFRLNMARLALGVLSVVLLVGPLLGTVFVYRDNLSGLVIPAELKTLVNSDHSGSLSGLGSENVSALNGSSVSVTFSNSSLVNGSSVSVSLGGLSDKPLKASNITTVYDPVSRTVRFSFDFTNPLGIGLSLNSLTADVSCTEHNFAIGSAVLASPVVLAPNATVPVAVVATWTESAIAHFASAHAGEKAISVDLSNLKVDLGGFSLSLPSKITIPDVPLS